MDVNVDLANGGDSHKVWDVYFKPGQNATAYMIGLMGHKGEPEADTAKHILGLPSARKGRGMPESLRKNLTLVAEGKSTVRDDGPMDTSTEGMEEDDGIEKKSTHPSLERSPGKKDNWVEQTGGLPAYIDDIARALHYERGMSIGRAIATAVSRCRMWAAGGDDVKADTRAKAAKAIASWEAKKKRAKTG